MFRDLMRKKQQLSRQECMDLLCRETRGVLSVAGDEGYPYGMPMNHWYHEEDGCIYFHTGKAEGHRLAALKRSDKVSFCVYNQGTREAGQWAWNVKSVIVFGRVELVEDLDTVVDITRRLCYKFTTDEDYIQKELAQSARNTLLLRLVPEHMCGKLVNEA